MMHGPINIRFTNAKQAKIIHEYKNIKRRLTNSWSQAPEDGRINGRNMLSIQYNKISGIKLVSLYSTSLCYSLKMVLKGLLGLN